jgi:glycopeptide antibiotics resistance protein
VGSLHTRLERLRLPALLGYIVVLLLATMTPFVPDPDPGRMMLRLAAAAHPQLRPADIVDAARNIVLFAGWGLVWMATAPPQHAWRSIARATGTGAAMSFTLEVCQLASRNRYSSILDVITNTTGSFLGALFLAALVRTVSEHRERKSYFGLPAALLAGGYGTGALLEATIPLFRDQVPGWLHGGPLVRASYALSMFRWNSIFDLAYEDLVLFFPAGALAVVALAERGMDHSRAARRAMLGGLAIATLAELVHAPLGEPIILGSIIVNAGGVALGAWAAGRWLSPFSQQFRGANRPRVLVALYSLVLVVWAWRPLLPEGTVAAMAAKLRGHWWVPLAMTGSRMDMYSVADVCVPFFLAVPLGALLAVWPLRQAGALRTALPGLYFAAALEAGQLFIVGRSPDVTDFLIAAAGVISGWLVLRRAGYQPHGELLLPRPAKATP